MGGQWDFSFFTISHTSGDRALSEAEKILLKMIEGEAVFGFQAATGSSSEDEGVSTCGNEEHIPKMIFVYIHAYSDTYLFPVFIKWERMT